MLKAVLGALLLALAPEQVPRSAPTVKSNVTIVEVDVVVVDKAGQPVRGLRKEDFAVTEDGGVVDIATFSAIDIPPAPAAAGTQAPERSGSAFASNDRRDDGRLILIVLDDVQSALDPARIAVVKTVARRAVARLGPDDQAGVMMTSGRRGTGAEFTTDRARLLDVIDRFLPQREPELPAIAGESPPTTSTSGSAERVVNRRTQAAMAGLTAAARALAMIPHRRKGVLLISQGFPASLQEVVRDPLIGAAYESIREFMLTAQRSNVAVYTADPCGLENDRGCNSDSRQNLRTIAEATGGLAIVNSNSPEALVDRMLAESGSYYLLGYSSPAVPNDGKHHRISVRTRVPDVAVRAREGYDSPGKQPKPAPATPLEVLSRAPLQTGGLTMRVVAIPAPLGTEPAAAVLVGIELPTALARRAGRIDFAISAIDGDGATRARARFTTDFSSADTAAAWIRTGSRIDVAPGEYQIRVAAIGADKTEGSVFLDVAVPHFDTGLGVGGLSLGAGSATGLTDADRLRGVLPLVPFATNQIGPGGGMTAQLPIRVSPKAAANPMTITAILQSADGATATLDRREINPRDYAGAAGKVYQIALPPTLPMGRYRLVVESALGRTTVAREVTFSIVSRNAKDLYPRR
jgi:VWFA-related protein